MNKKLIKGIKIVISFIVVLLVINLASYHFLKRVIPNPFFSTYTVRPMVLSGCFNYCKDGEEGSLISCEMDIYDMSTCYYYCTSFVGNTCRD